MPKVQAALELYDLLKVSNTDLRQPVGLEEQLLKDDAMDTEVGQSMLQLLQVRPLPLSCTLQLLHVASLLFLACMHAEVGQAVLQLLQVRPLSCPLVAGTKTKVHMQEDILHKAWPKIISEIPKRCCVFF